METLYFILSIPGLIFSTMGLIFILVSRTTVRPDRDWLTTTGTIIQKEKNYSISLNNIINKKEILSTAPDRAPTFHYEVNGVEYETTSKVQQTPGFQIGSTVEVLYNPDDPEQAVINSFLQKGTLFNILGKTLFFFGATLLLIALLIFVFN